MSMTTKFKKASFFSGLILILLIESLGLAGVRILPEDKKIDLAITLLTITAWIIFKNKEKLDEISDKIDSDHLPSVFNISPPEMKDLLEGHLKNLDQNIINIHKNKSVKIEGKKNFTPYFNKTMEVFSKHSFFATSDLHNTKFWDTELVEKTKKFIRNGGTIERVFYIESFESLNENDFLVLDQQLEAGVIVYAIPSTDISEYKNYLVEKNGKIGWEVFKEPITNEVLSATFHVKNINTKNLINHFSSIKYNPKIKKYLGNKKFINI